LAYLAGYLDGEGCFMFQERTAAVCVSTTYPHILHWIKSLFYGTVALKNQMNGRNRAAYSWRVYGSNAERVCRMVLPYLKEKKRQAELVLQARQATANSELRKAAEEELKALKRINYE
jgi:hypothetical protein